MLGVSGTYRAIFDIIRGWNLTEILVEMKALGASVVAELQVAIRRGWYIDRDTDERSELLGPDGQPTRAVVTPCDPGREDKRQRAHAMLPAWEQGLIFLLDGAPFLYPQVDENRRTVDEGTVGELCSSPKSRRTHCVDAWSQYLTHKRTPTRIEEPDVTYGAELL